MKRALSDILRNYVLEQRQKNPTVNETSISKKINVPPTTFNRLLNGYSKPSLKTFSKLLKFIPELESVLPSDIFQIVNITLERKNRECMIDNLNSLLSNKDIFLCWVLSFSEKGTTEEEVKKNFGEQGLKALNVLLEKKIIVKTEDQHYKVIKKTQDMVLSFHLIQAHLMFLVEQYNPSKLKDNYIHYSVESLNEESHKELLEAHREFYKKVRKIMDSKENRGSRLAFSIACSDLLWDKVRTRKV